MIQVCFLINNNKQLTGFPENVFDQIEQVLTPLKLQMLHLAIINTCLLLSYAYCNQ
jgi:hypothetical protein